MKEYDREVRRLKKKAEQEKEEMKNQFKTYWQEIKLIYDKEKDELKKKIIQYSEIGNYR